MSRSSPKRISIDRFAGNDSKVFDSYSRTCAISCSDCSSSPSVEWSRFITVSTSAARFSLSWTNSKVFVQIASNERQQGPLAANFGQSVRCTLRPTSSTGAGATSSVGSTHSFATRPGPPLPIHVAKAVKVTGSKWYSKSRVRYVKSSH